MRAVTVAVTAMVALAGCEAPSRSTQGPGPQPYGAGRSVTRPAQLPKTTDSVAALVRRGVDSLTSATFRLQARSASSRIVATGRVTLHAGVVTGLDITVSAGAVRNARVVSTAHEVFVQLAGKPRVPVGAKAAPPVQRAARLAASLAPLVSPPAMLDVVTAGRVRLVGSGVLSSVPFARYAAVTSTGALPVSATRAAWSTAAVASVQLDLRVERHGRPLLAQWRLSGHPPRAQPVTGTVRFGKYNQPPG